MCRFLEDLFMFAIGVLIGILMLTMFKPIEINAKCPECGIFWGETINKNENIVCPSCNNDFNNIILHE